MAEEPEQKPVEKPRFLENGKPRSETVELDYPVEFQGKTWTHITVRRMTTAEVSEFVKSLGKVEGDERVLPPMFDAPIELLNGLDADDDEKVQEVANRFLPRRFQARPKE